MNIQTSTVGCSDTDAASEAQAVKVLLKLGIPANTKGFYYIKTAVLLGLHTPIGMTSMTKTVYPTIAECYRAATPSAVERAMRYAIAQSCLRGDSTFICQLFGYANNIRNYNPTNREFLAVVSEYIKQAHISEPLAS